MNRNLEFPEDDSAAAEIHNLNSAKVDVKAQIAEFPKCMASEKEMLASLIAQPKITEKQSRPESGQESLSVGFKGVETKYCGLSK